MLNRRKMQILRALINEFVESSNPVASGTLVDRYKLGVSSATVRSILAHLENEGFLEKPHVSAGRVPTDLGYRAFVNDMLKSKEWLDGTQSFNWTYKDESDEDFLRRVTDDLAEKTNSLVVVSEPVESRAVISRITLVPVGSEALTIVVITTEGRVVSRTIDTSIVLDLAEVSVLESRFNRLLNGSSVAQAVAEMGSYAQTSTSLLELKVLMSLQSFLPELEEGREQHRGSIHLFEYPELRTTDSIVSLLEVLEGGSNLVEKLWNETDQNTENISDIRVLIGSEAEDIQLVEFSVVMEPFKMGNSIGLVALIGPKRMNYAGSLAAVHQGARAFETHL